MSHKVGPSIPQPCFAWPSDSLCICQSRSDARPHCHKHGRNTWRTEHTSVTHPQGIAKLSSAQLCWEQCSFISGLLFILSSLLPCEHICVRPTATEKISAFRFCFPDIKDLLMYCGDMAIQHPHCMRCACRRTTHSVYNAGTVGPRGQFKFEVRSLNVLKYLVWESHGKQ